MYNAHSTYTIAEYRNVSDKFETILDSATSNEESLNDGQILRVILDTLNEELAPNERIMPYNDWMDACENRPETIAAVEAVMTSGSALAVNLVGENLSPAEEQTLVQYGQGGQHFINILREYCDRIAYCPEAILYDAISNLPCEYRTESSIRLHVWKLIGHERRHTEQSEEFKMEGRLDLAMAMGKISDDELTRKYRELSSEVDADTAGMLFAIERL